MKQLDEIKACAFAKIARPASELEIVGPIGTADARYRDFVIDMIPIRQTLPAPRVSALTILRDIQCENVSARVTSWEALFTRATQSVRNLLYASPMFGMPFAPSLPTPADALRIVSALASGSFKRLLGMRSAPDAHFFRIVLARVFKIGKASDTIMMPRDLPRMLDMCSVVSPLSCAPLDNVLEIMVQPAAACDRLSLHLFAMKNVMSAGRAFRHLLISGIIFSSSISRHLCHAKFGRIVPTPISHPLRVIATRIAQMIRTPLLIVTAAAQSFSDNWFTAAATSTFHPEDHSTFLHGVETAQGV